MLEIKHLEKSYGTVTPLKDINCTIKAGEVISLIGGSGTGKSTLLRCINGLEQPTAGEILFNGRNILDPGTDMTEIRKHIGMIFQSFNLFPHLTVLQNVMIPQMDLLNRTKQDAYDRAVELLKQVGLFEKVDVYPNALSGGQKQRVAIARTLAMDNEIILLDEPTSALDPAMVGEVEGVIRNLTKLGKTMLIVTHEMRFAKSVSSRIFFLSDGIIWEDGTPEQIFEHPEKEKTRQFIFRIHEHSINIESPYFDFYNCMTDIAHFGERHYLSSRTIERIRAVFEEIVMIHMIPTMTAKDKIFINLSCSELTENVSMTIHYTEGLFDPDKDLDKLSKAIVNHNAVSTVLSVSSKNGFTHQIDVAINKD